MHDFELIEQLGVALEHMSARGVTLRKGPDSDRGGATIVLDAKTAEAICSALENALELLESSSKTEADCEDALSPRQVEVLSWVAAGKSNNVIAEIMGISAHTVDTHLRRIFSRLGTTDRTVAAIEAIKRGLIKQPFPSVA